MPVLGSTPGKTSGIYRRGVHIPAHALDTWAAARDNHASQLAEAVWFGDSTSFGSEYSANNYSIVDRLRDRWRADGLTDGGKGFFAGGEATMTGRDAAYDVNGVVSNQWNAISDQFDTCGGQYFRSNTAGQLLTLHGYGTRFKVWFTKRASGQMGVAIDGGTETIIDTYGQTGTTQAWQLFSGLSAGSLHSVVLRCVGGRPILAPSGGLSAAVDTNTFSGSLTSGQAYYYKLTYYKSGVGETDGSATLGPCTPTGTTLTVLVGANPTATGATYLPAGFQYGIYRATSAGGPYTRLAYVNGGSQGILTYRDDGTVTPAGAIPSTNTAGLDSQADVFAAAEFTNNTGIVFHKHATSGNSFYSYLDPTNRSGSSGYTQASRVQGALGVVQSQSTNVQNASWWQAQDTTTAARRPALAVMHMGFNDVNNIPKPWRSFDAHTTGDMVYYADSFWAAQANSTGVTPGSDATKWLPTEPQYSIDELAQGAYEFILLARASGADPLVCVGQFPMDATAFSWSARATAVLMDVALSTGAGFVNLIEGLGQKPSDWIANGAQAGANPHLTKAGYQRQADFIWDNVLSQSAYR